MQSRIRELRKSLNLTQAAFGERIAVKASTITNYETGLRVPSDSIIRSICREFGVSETWLRTGEGTMFVPQTPDAQIAAYVASTLKGSNEFKKAVLSLLLSRSDEELAVIERAYRDLGVMLAQRERQRSDPDAL